MFERFVEEALKVDLWLLEQGYREFNHGLPEKGRERCFQKSYRHTNIQGDGKCFFNIYKFSLHDLYSTRPDMEKFDPISYEVEMCFASAFEPPFTQKVFDYKTEKWLGHNPWFKGEFYGLRSHELQKHLPMIENKLALMFDLLDGIPQS